MNNLKGVLAVLSIFALIGFGGGLEQNMLTLAQYIVYSLICLGVMGGIAVDNKIKEDK